MKKILLLLPSIILVALTLAILPQLLSGLQRAKPGPEVIYSSTGSNINIYSTEVSDTVRLMVFADTHLWMSDEREEPYREYSARMAGAYHSVKHFQTGAQTTPEESFVATIRLAQQRGVDAIAMVPGFYYGLKVPVVRKYWCDVLEATDNVPMFIYNIPGTTNGFNLPVELLQEMLATGRVAGVKNSSGSVQDILKFRMAGGEDMAIFNGPDEQYVAGRMMGASGGIGGTYGYMPEAFLKLDALVNAGEMEKAAQMQKEITSIIYDTLKIGSLYAAAKGVLQLRGQELGGVRAPFLNLKSGDEVAVRDIHEKIQALLARW